MPDFYLIRYRYPGTTDDKPVGDVYVQAVPPRVAGRSDVFSYTKDPAKATCTVAERAEDLIGRYDWPGARLVPMVGAEVLP